MSLQSVGWLYYARELAAPCCWSSWSKQMHIQFNYSTPQYHIDDDDVGNGDDGDDGDDDDDDGDGAVHLVSATVPA